jgi:poly [ADP-ribose] polymerase
MAHTIEVAKSGRATCRTCRQAITKGEVRFGEEAPNAFSDSGGTMHMWHHLLCAAKKKPGQLREAMTGSDVEISNRAEVEAIIAAEEPKQKPVKMPYAERAPTGRARCGECGETIEKGELRIATPREVETGGMMNASVRYLHPGCAAAVGDDATGLPRTTLLGELRANSKGLADEDVVELTRAFE